MVFPSVDCIDEFMSRNNYASLTHQIAGRGPFLESPDNQRAGKAVVVFVQDRGFNSFASNLIKLSVNETKWSSLLAGTRSLILYISI